MVRITRIVTLLELWKALTEAFEHVFDGVFAVSFARCRHCDRPQSDAQTLSAAEVDKRRAIRFLYYKFLLYTL